MPYNFMHSLRILTSLQDRTVTKKTSKNQKSTRHKIERLLKQEAMGWRSRQHSASNIDVGVDAAGNGYGIPVHNVYIYVGKIFDVNEKTLDTLNTSPC